MNSQELPPTLVPSAHVGRSPQYSAISVGASRPVPHDPKPSTSALVSPASANARDAAWWCSSYAVLTSTRPQSDSAAPTIATLFRSIVTATSPVYGFGQPAKRLG